MPAVAISMMTSLVAVAAETQIWPTKPLRMLTAELGGGSDLSARLIAQGLSGNLGQQVVVDNRPGAAGAIGHRAIVNARPDGLTFGIAAAGLLAAAALASYLPAHRASAINPTEALRME